MILIRYAIAEFFTAKMTYWMACYHTEKTDQSKMDYRVKWLAYVYLRDMLIKIYKFLLFGWILGCFVAEIVIIFTWEHGKPFSKSDDFDMYE